MADTRLKTILGHLNGKPEAPRFRYTLDNTLLTPEQRQFYEQHGFVVIRKLVDPNLLDACKERFLALCNGIIPKGGITMMKDVALAKMKDVTGERLFNKAQDFVYDDVLFQYCLYPKILDYVEGFTGPNIRAMHTMLINKPPDPGSKTSRHPLHQVPLSLELNV